MSDMDEGGEGEMADGLDPSMMGDGAAGSGGLVLPGLGNTAKLASQSLMAVQGSIL
jgi:hypothetical protein